MPSRQPARCRHYLKSPVLLSLQRVQERNQLRLLLRGKNREFVSGDGSFSFVAEDRLFPSCGSAVMHQTVAGPQTPQWSGSQFVHGVGGAVLDNAISGSDVMQQEIAEGVDHLPTKSIRHSKGSTVDHRAGGRGGDGSDMAGCTTDLGENLLSGLRIGCG